MEQTYVQTYITLDPEELDLLGIPMEDREDLDVVNDAIHDLIYKKGKETIKNLSAAIPAATSQYEDLPYMPISTRDDIAISKVTDILAHGDREVLEAMQQAIESEMDISISRLLRDYVSGNVEDMSVALTGWDMRALLIKAEMYNKEENEDE